MAKIQTAKKSEPTAKTPEQKPHFDEITSIHKSKSANIEIEN
jgi:hypothetical protein